MNMDRPADDPGARTAARFATTHWSVVLAAGDSASTDSQEALEKLSRAYWYPLYSYARRRGYGGEDAKDLTQAFFERLLAKNFLKDAARDRGRFRTFLLTAMKHFLANEQDRAHAVKRGGRDTVVSLDMLMAEDRFADAAGRDLSPDQAFDRAWAESLMDAAYQRLKSDYVRDGRGQLFERLASCLLNVPAAGKYDALARE